jgi:hypothetical protein
MSRELLQQCLDLITELDKDGVVLEAGLIFSLREELAKRPLPMSPEHLPQYIATNNIKPTTEGGGGAGGELAKPERKWLGLSDAELMKEFGYTDVLLRDTAYRVDQLLEWKNT